MSAMDRAAFDKTLEVAQQLRQWLEHPTGNLDTVVQVGRAQGMAWAGAYFSSRLGAIKHHAFFERAVEQLAEHRQRICAETSSRIPSCS